MIYFNLIITKQNVLEYKNYTKLLLGSKKEQYSSTQ